MLDITTTSTWAGPTASDYERALWHSLYGPAAPVILHGDDGLVIRLDVSRYAAVADDVDRRLLEHCTGPTLDIGCGPGRLAAELARRGVPALGVDVTPVALLLARASGATVLGRSVFDRLPAEGRWPHALLIDGNIGISGDPAALLARIKALLLPVGATLTVETTLYETDERHLLRPPGTASGPAIPWARIGPTALRALAEPLGYRPTSDRILDGRRFVQLDT
ncbi:class I SAM-dependent methyltransferase [Actinospica sp.]|uniref:class I SAM-dependent methyltransferase n=1 Tax=Actinospica sp. TaxID=1872142 RepID=UPI002CFD5023|nr:methyltransferase domain-containing protein [Actinospica sp.]HWG23252.1 methyltransferase domain-containing protein [Actinospica sp.]